MQHSRDRPVPARNVATARPRALQRPTRYFSRQQAEDIRAQRGRLMDELARWREQSDASLSSVAKAQELLTRWWSRADWSGRAELLKAAEWLIRLEQRRSSEAQRPV